MIQYNTLIIKIPNSQLNKLKTGITLNFSSNVVENCKDETNFPYNILSLKLSKI